MAYKSEYEPRVGSHQGYAQSGDDASWYGAPENAWPDEQVSDAFHKPAIGATQWTAAAVSLALIVGMGVWGYKLMVRDVNGVPVVRALEGEARVAPEDPGGELASYRGLAVNTIAAEGEAAAPPDRIVLAPAPVDLTDEDQPIVPGDAVLKAAQPAAPEPEVLEPTLTSLSVEESPLELNDVETVSGSTEDVAAAEMDEVPTPELTGIKSSPLPAPRPKRVAAAAPAQVSATDAVDLSGIAGDIAAALGAVDEIAPADIAPNTRLVQFGAYPDAEVARSEWERIAANYDEYMVGKSRVIEKAEAGGRTFYRLRALGFEDAADSARFCAALTALDQTCVPVAHR